MSRRLSVQSIFLSMALLAGRAAGQPATTAANAYEQQLQAATMDADRGNISAAMAEVKAALALAPDRYEGWYELGTVLGQTGDFHNAEAALRKAIQLKPDLAKAHYGLALTLIGNPQGKMDWVGAIAECREALKYQPDYAQALNLLGSGLSATGQTEAAIPVLEHAIQLSPSLAEAHFNLGLALESRGITEGSEKQGSEVQLDRAASEYRAAVAAKGSYPLATSALGNLLFQSGKTDEAERALDQALRQNPDLTDAHYALARLLRSLHRTKEAAVEFAETKDLTDRFSNGIQSSQLSNQALQVAAKGEMKEAASLLQKAIALKPDYGVPHYNLGLILADSGQITAAERELAKAISLLPGQAKPWFDYGRVLRLAKDAQGAQQAIAWAAKLAPTDAAIRAELASVQGGSAELPTQPKVGAASDSATDHLAFARELKAQGDFQGAIGELLRSLALDPAAIEPRRSLAESYVLLGENQHAILEFHKVLRSAPEDSAAQIALGKLAAPSGEPATRP